MARIDAILKLVKEQGASDLHMTTGSPPMVRINGEITPIPYEKLTPELAQLLLFEIMDADLRAKYERDKDVDFAYEVPGVVRARCNIYEQNQGVAGRVPPPVERHPLARAAGPARAPAEADDDAARTRARDRTSGHRQVQHAGDADRPYQPDLPQAHSHHRGSDRISAQERAVDGHAPRGRPKHAELRAGAQGRAASRIRTSSWSASCATRIPWRWRSQPPPPGSWCSRRCTP